MRRARPTPTSLGTASASSASGSTTSRGTKRQRKSRDAAIAEGSPGKTTTALAAATRKEGGGGAGRAPPRSKRVSAFVSLKNAFENPLTVPRYISAEVGRGLFAVAPFAKGDYITQFTGVMITRCAAEKRPCKRFMISLGHDFVIDTYRDFPDVAKKSRPGSSAFGYAQYANHQPDRALLNSKVETVVIGSRRTQRTYPNTVWLRATRDIETGDQILYTYGKSFSAHHPGPVAKCFRKYKE